jgi:hypothetical protein
MKRWSSPGLLLNKTVTLMPTALSFPCCVILRKIKGESTTSLTHQIIRNTHFVVFFCDLDLSEQNTKQQERFFSEIFPAVQLSEMEVQIMFPNKQQLEELRAKYPTGTKIILHHMNDPYPVPTGTIGKVQFVDDGGNIHVLWSNGSTLAVIEGVDSFSIVPVG